VLDDRASDRVGLQRSLRLPAHGVVRVGVDRARPTGTVGRDTAHVLALPREGFEALTGFTISSLW
jgi:hypothetical protein